MTALLFGRALTFGVLLSVLITLLWVRWRELAKRRIAELYRKISLRVLDRSMKLTTGQKGVKGPPPRHDVEVSAVDSQFDLVPVSPPGIQAMSDYLGRAVEPHVPVRMTKHQYRCFCARRNVLSIGMQRKFLGQRRHVPADFSERPSHDLLDRLDLNPTTLHVRNHDFVVACSRYGPSMQELLYKVTETKYTPLDSLAISLGTLDYYRDTADKSEGSFTASSNNGVLRTLDGEVIADSRSLERLGISVNPCWVYCATIVSRRNGMRREQVEWFKESRRATPIVAPVDHFAMMLGVSFGVWSKPRIRQVYEWIESVEILRHISNGILVIHGEVRYMNPSERDRYLEGLHRSNRQLWMTESVFTKNIVFAPEREYRFGIWGWGPPLRDQIVLPATKQLLECYGPSVTVGRLKPSGWSSR